MLLSGKVFHSVLDSSRRCCEFVKRREKNMDVCDGAYICIIFARCSGFFPHVRYSLCDCVFSEGVSIWSQCLMQTVQRCISVSPDLYYQSDKVQSTFDGQNKCKVREISKCNRKCCAQIK